jgi:hypothetical protein
MSQILRFWAMSDWLMQSAHFVPPEKGLHRVQPHFSAWVIMAQADGDVKAFASN